MAGLTDNLKMMIEDLGKKTDALTEITDKISYIKN